MANAVILPEKPDHLSDFGCLIGCIVAPKNGGEFTKIVMVTSQFFSGEEVANHANLSNLDYASSGHTGFAKSGANDDITSMTGLNDNGIPVAKVDGALADIVDDTTPQLGGELDAQAHSIGFTAQTATGDGATTIDWKLGNKFHFTHGAMNETFTFTAPSKPCNLLLKINSFGMSLFLNIDDCHINSLFPVVEYKAFRSIE